MAIPSETPWSAIPKFAIKFLDTYPSPSEVVPSPTVLDLYRSKIEKEFVSHFSGSGRPRTEILMGRKEWLDYQTVAHENYPGDWEWRRYLVKHLAGWRCAACNLHISQLDEPLDADHIVEICRWRAPKELFGAALPPDELVSASNALGAHSLENLQALCRTHHGVKHRRY